MWPWEHVAVGYLLFSLYTRAVHSRPPTAAGAVTVAFAALAPDLIDKPLSWVLGVLPGGRTLGHSLVFAVPLVALVGAIAATAGTAPLGVAFALGYFSHLPADAIYPALVGGEVRLAFLAWPFAGTSVSGSSPALLAHVRVLVATFLRFLATPEGARYLLLEVGLLAAAALLWVLDGAPGVGLLRAAVADGDRSR